MFGLPHVLAVSVLGLAVISAGSAVVGSLVGGGVTGFLALKGEKKRQEFARSIEQRKEEREDRATLALARGAGREWARRFSDNRATIVAAYQRGHWWPSEVDIQTFTVHEDRKLVASMLSAEDFRAVEIAESNLYSTVMVREIAFEGLPDDADLPRIGDQAEERLRQTVARLEAADRELRIVGEPRA
jgi:uncharacterized protein YjhX (UPF0386 family)